MKRHYFLLIAGVLLFASCSDQPSGPDPAGNDIRKAAPTEQGTEDFDLTDRYIVVFKKDVRNTDAAINDMTRGKVSKIHYRYHYAIKGFCATIPPQALEGIRHNPNVAYIEADGIASINTIQPVTSLRWGLDRIDQRTLPLSGSYEYLYTGAGVRVYIIDTGIRYTHTEFGGRAYFGFDTFGGDGSDANGHGTHVAGIVGGSSVGVAKNVTLYSVRVLNSSGSGTWSGVADGVDWVASQTVFPAVANMSLGGGASQTVDDAVRGAVAAGVTMVVAAGNENNNAGNYSPARVAEAITVGSTTITDERSSFSNYGNVLDVFAPGSSIYSSYKTSNSSYTTMSGTSMASPCVAGVAALYLQSNTNASPAAVSAAITSTATTGVVTNPGTGSPNRLVYSLLTGSPNPTLPAPSNLIATAASGSINLSWTNNATTGSISIERSTNGTNFSVQSQVQYPVAAYQDQNLQPGTYYYRVQAVDGSTTSSYSNVASALITAPSTSVYIGDWWTSTSSSKNTWRAALKVKIVDAPNGQSISGASVRIDWTGSGGSGSGTATTNSLGEATVYTSYYNKKTVPSLTLSVFSVTYSLPYNPGLNKSGLPINVLKP